MKRFLAPLPATFDIGQVATATRAAFPKALDCNQVDVSGTPNAAVYFEDADAPGNAAIDRWTAAVAAHVPQPNVDPVADARSRLQALRAKGWANLTAAEKAEVSQRALDVLGT